MYKQDFFDLDKHIWLNAASEGPLLRVASDALKEAVEWKSKPYLMTIPKFIGVIRELKDSIGKLIGVPSKDVILGNSASYGLHILANGIRWNAQDEVVVMHNDFPTNILPWLALEEKGVVVRQLQARDKVLTPVEFEESITDKTRLLCLSHVHTFTGQILDIVRFAEICKQRNIIFVLNISQTVGNIPLDISRYHVDAVVTAGYKWLCGPYGTGFCWIKPELREQLDYNQAYWSAVLTEENLKGDDALLTIKINSAKKYDVFGTANFFNFVPFRASIDYFCKHGLGKIYEYNQDLIEHFCQGLDRKRYVFISSTKREDRSNLIVISHKDSSQNEIIFKKLNEKNIHTAFWKGNIRISPHIYNTAEDIHVVVRFLNTLILEKELI